MAIREKVGLWAGRRLTCTISHESDLVGADNFIYFLIRVTYGFYARNTVIHEGWLRKCISDGDSCTSSRDHNRGVGLHQP